jgi:hypothetical protein
MNAVAVAARTECGSLFNDTFRRQAIWTGDSLRQARAKRRFYWLPTVDVGKKVDVSYTELSAACSTVGCLANRSAADSLRRFAGRAALLAIWSLYAIVGRSVAADGVETTGTTRFINRTYGLSLVLPAGWVSVPVKLVNAPVGQMVSENLAQQTQAIAAFQPGPDRSAIDRPFCTMQAVQSGWRGGPTPKQFDLVMQAMSAGTQVLIDKTAAMALYSPTEIKELSTLLAGATPGPLHADPKTRRFWRVVDGTDSADQPVRSLSTGMFLTNGYMITLNCYADRAQFRRVVGDFAAIDRSTSDLIP